MTGIVSVYATFPNSEEARSIARTLVEEGLAACANILGECHSIYRWEGRVEEGAEVAAIFKTSAAGARPMIERLRALHSYDVPATVVWNIEDVPLDYLRWVMENSPR
jgi:periplasmic divalent cation tolerance protein